MTPRRALLLCGAGGAASLDWEQAAGHMSPQQARTCEQAVPGLRSIHAAVFPYYTPPQPGANLCLYARGEDYHRVLRRRMGQAAQQLEAQHPGHRFVPFADASPFPEVLLALLCGLGVLGEHGLLITPRFGSYVFIGLLASTLPCADPALPVRHCPGCMACVRACPGGALRGSGFCPGRCLSHLTQMRAQPDGEQLALLRRSPLIWGCDVCQSVCPLNQGLSPCALPEFCENLIHSLSQQDLALSDRQFRKRFADRAFSWRGVAPLRRNLLLLQGRNE